MMLKEPHFTLRLANSREDQQAAQRLRYKVFVEELGGNGPLVDHAGRLEADRFDPFFDHLILVDERRNRADLDHVVGVYRLMRGAQAARAGQFYTEDEYTLAPLRDSGRRLLELGRSCVHRDYRGGTAMHQLWSGLAAYIDDYKIDVLFGVASFHGTDLAALASPLSLLYARHLAPPELRVRAHDHLYQAMDLMAGDVLDRRSAMLKVPTLIKAYLRLGGFVGDGAYIDHAFNTTDVCVVMDTARLSSRYSGYYSPGSLRLKPS